MTFSCVLNTLPFLGVFSNLALGFLHAAILNKEEALGMIS